jgi:hypothetical protein
VRLRIICLPPLFIASRAPSVVHDGMVVITYTSVSPRGFVRLCDGQD